MCYKCKIYTRFQKLRKKKNCSNFSTFLCWLHVKITCYVTCGCMGLDKICYLKIIWDFPSNPEVKTPRFHCREYGFDPWLGTKILHAGGHSLPPKEKKFIC